MRIQLQAVSALTCMLALCRAAESHSEFYKGLSPKEIEEVKRAVQLADDEALAARLNTEWKGRVNTPAQPTLPDTSRDEQLARELAGRQSLANSGAVPTPAVLADEAYARSLAEQPERPNGPPRRHSPSRDNGHIRRRVEQRDHERNPPAPRRTPFPPQMFPSGPFTVPGLIDPLTLPFLESQRPKPSQEMELDSEEDLQQQALQRDREERARQDAEYSRAAEMDRLLELQKEEEARAERQKLQAELAKKREEEQAARERARAEKLKSENEEELRDEWEHLFAFQSCPARCSPGPGAINLKVSFPDDALSQIALTVYEDILCIQLYKQVIVQACMDPRQPFCLLKREHLRNARDASSRLRPSDVLSDVAQGARGLVLVVERLAPADASAFVKDARELIPSLDQ